MLLFLLVALAASTVGALSGLGGGIIIKPVLDATSGLAAAQINFLSGFAVLCMSGMTLFRRRQALRATADRQLFALAAGSAVGGVAGKMLFDLLCRGFDRRAVSLVQSGILGLMCVFILIYMARKAGIRTRRIEAPWAPPLAGLGLGVVSAFLGIGGGPLNIILLSYFFSMAAGRAALSSLFIIFFSQAAGLLVTLARGRPQVELAALALMGLGGVLGGLLGGHIGRRFSDRHTERFFNGVTLLIVFISGYNVISAL